MIAMVTGPTGCLHCKIVRGVGHLVMISIE
jgi:hypothetical protein